MACARNKSLASAECIGEDLSANNREYMVLEGSEGGKIIANKNEPKQFNTGKHLTLETATNSRPVSCAIILHVLKTAMAAVSKARVI